MCVCVPSFSVLAAATFSPRTRETPDLLSCCKKLSSLDRLALELNISMHDSHVSHFHFLLLSLSLTL